MPKVVLGGNNYDVSYCFHCYPINANACGFFVLDVNNFGQLHNHPLINFLSVRKLVQFCSMF